MREKHGGHTLLILANSFGLFVVAVLGVMLSLHLLSDGETVVIDRDTTKHAAWYVAWPESGAHLDALQTFVITPVITDVAEQVFARWEVDGGIRRGTLESVGGKLSTVVDTTSWDWNSNNRYEVAFTVFSHNNQELSKIVVPVFVGGVPEPILEPASEPLLEMEYPQTEDVVLKIEDRIDVVEVERREQQVLGAQSFSVEWVPGPINQNQRFVYRLDGYDPDAISVFWKSQGGQDNHVFPNDRGVFETAINVNGWRWQGQGPYQLIFSVVDKRSSDLLMTETFEMSWLGQPGESELAMESQGVKSLATALPPTTATSMTVATVSTPAQQDVAPLVADMTDVATASTAPVSSAISNHQVISAPAPTQTYSVRSDQRLLSVAKPAIEQSLVSTQDENHRAALSYIKEQPNAVWLNGDGHDSNEYISRIIMNSKSQNAMPVFVLYNIPHRDCGSHSSGGAKSTADYRSWIDRLAGLLENERGIVVVEPDALAQLNCAPEESRSERLQLISYAVQKLSFASPELRIYIDAGHPYWVNSTEMARRLSLAGVSNATGFSLNVSNFVSTNDNITYGNHLSNLLGGKRYVIDTSRNGNGPSPAREWCNPDGRALGHRPQLVSGTGKLDAYLWIKFPGESDGQCNGGPRAGGWWPEYAVGLYSNRL
jgi:endoglucanase